MLHDAHIPHFGTKAALTAICSLGLAACAQSPDLCSIDDIHATREAPIDFGKGFVSSLNSVSLPESLPVEYLEIVDCRTNEFIDVEFFLYGPEDGEVMHHPDGTLVKPEFDKRHLRGEFASRLQAGEFESLSSIEELATTMGLRIRHTGVQRSENCGCGVFYPELRGDKEPSKRLKRTL